MHAKKNLNIIQCLMVYSSLAVLLEQQIRLTHVWADSDQYRINLALK